MIVIFPYYTRSPSESCSVVSDSLQSHGLYSSRNSPSQNTGVDSISPSPGDLPNPSIEPRSSALQADSSPAEPQGNSKNTGVGSLSLLQGIFPTQGSNPGLLHCRWILYQLSHKESLRILEWVAYPFSSGSSQPRNRTGVSCIAGGLFLPTELSGTPKGDGSY